MAEILEKTTSIIMVRILFVFMLCNFSLTMFGQGIKVLEENLQRTYIQDAFDSFIEVTPKITLPPKKITLIDTINSVKFILDSSHIYIMAINQKGDTLWKTDPWKDNNLMKYGTERPIVVSLGLNLPSDAEARHCHLSSKETVIWIEYDNTQFGIINQRTGQFYFEGQD